MKNKKIILSVVFFLVFLFGNIVLAADTTKNSLPFTPAIKIPGFEVTEIDGSSLGKYIVAIYRYGGMFAGVVAMFMLVYAGWEWLMAAGNASKISSAKNKINSVLIGLALLFGGYMLLSLISTNLIQFNSLNTAIPKPPCSLFIQEKDCLAPSCVWVPATPEEITRDATIPGKCMDITAVQIDDGETTCEDFTTEPSCRGVSACEWDTATSKCKVGTLVCGLNAAQVAANPSGLNCYARMENNDPNSPVAEYKYVVYPINGRCLDACNTGVWRTMNIDVCQTNLGF